MKIAFYASMKPLDHPTPSGDRTIGRELCEYLAKRGQTVFTPSKFICRNIYKSPWKWPLVQLARKKALKECSAKKADIWLTYISYYKSPDVIGPHVAEKLGIPYVIFQSSYSTKHQKQSSTRKGFELNKKALEAASMVFANKEVDFTNLKRLLPEQRLTYVRPGLTTKNFKYAPKAAGRIRSRWGVNDPVVMTVAMFRPGVKEESLSALIRACGLARKAGSEFVLAIAGDGPARKRLEALALEHIGGRVIFLGEIPREELYQYYSAADIFAYPGIGESLGMVYLEAQCCGLPAIAYADRGPEETIRPDKTGFIVPKGDEQKLAKAIVKLVSEPQLREKMSQKAADTIHREHDLSVNYHHVEKTLLEAAGMPCGDEP